MKLPHSLLENVGFIFEDVDELIRAAEPDTEAEKNEILRLFEASLPPITSIDTLSVMMGYNSGFTHSMTASVKSHYRMFSIPKGKSQRNIVAPKVALKGVQKWLSVHFQEKYEPPECVFGFIPGRSHLSAASQHLQAKWVCSVDIANFFPSVSGNKLRSVFEHLGYQSEQSITLLTRLCSIKGVLVQGSPASPVIANIALRNLDQQIADLADETGAVVTRYADDIVFSGKALPPEDILQRLKDTVEADGWRIAEEKCELAEAPNRLKVHGLLVHGDKIRLTKGYRNRIRAYRHLLEHNKVSEADLNSLIGHIRYAEQVEKS